jgi:uncharacterized protein (DUF488 family)
MGCRLLDIGHDGDTIMASEAHALDFSRNLKQVVIMHSKNVNTLRGKGSTPPAIIVFTVGHSTRTIDEFIHLLKTNGIRRLIDIRTIPRSRHNPQFNRETLSIVLRNRRISYRHMKTLGGLRHARVDSINRGWHNASFRGFADYMQTPEFEAALNKLIDLAVLKRTAIMCAEAVPWRCHRSLIGDALTLRGIEVQDILSDKNVRPHMMTPMARIRSGKITYPEE